MLVNETITDHYPILLKWEVKPDCSPSCQVYRDTSFLSNHRKTKFNEILIKNLKTNHNKLSIEPDVDKAFQIFHDTFDSTLLEFAPLKSAKKTTPAWFDNKLKNLRSKRNKAYKAWKSDTTNESLKVKFQEIRKVFEGSVKKSNKNLYWKKFNSCIGDSRQIYKLINDLNGKVKAKENIPPLDNIVNENNQSHSEIANQLNDFFTSVADSLKKDIPKTPLPIIERVEKSMFLYDVAPAETKCIIDSLDNKSS